MHIYSWYYYVSSVSTLRSDCYPNALLPALQNITSSFSFSSLRPFFTATFGNFHSWTQTGQSWRSICQLCPGSNNYTALLKPRQTFQIFLYVRLVLWISSLLWLNVVSRALFILTLVWVKLKGTCVSLPFQNQTLKSVTLCCGQNCWDVLIQHQTLHRATSAPLTLNKHWSHVTLLQLTWAGN